MKRQNTITFFEFKLKENNENYLIVKLQQNIKTGMVKLIQNSQNTTSIKETNDIEIEDIFENGESLVKKIPLLLNENTIKYIVENNLLDLIILEIVYYKNINNSKYKNRFKNLEINRGIFVSYFLVEFHHILNHTQKFDLDVFLREIKRGKTTIYPYIFVHIDDDGKIRFATNSDASLFINENKWLSKLISKKFVDLKLDKYIKKGN